MNIKEFNIKGNFDTNQNIEIIDNDKIHLNMNMKMKKKGSHRNRGGCFCCRKRKIKCDERKPVCLKCEKGDFLCCWPKNGNESLSYNMDFKLIKNKTSIKFINMAPSVEQDFKRRRIGNEKKENEIKIEEINNQNSQLTLTNQTNKLDEDAIIRQYIRERGQDILSKNVHDMFGMGLNNEEIKYYNAFINGFIVSISNQLTHEKLLPGSIFIPIAVFDPLVRELCLTCGASFLSRCNNENDKNLMIKVQKSNSLIVKEFINKLDYMPIMEIREWILIYFTLQNNRQKFFVEGRSSQTINLISGVQAIKLWIETKKREYFKKTKFFKNNSIIDDDSNEEKIDYNNNYNNDNIESEGDIYKIDEIKHADSYILLDKLLDKIKVLKSLNNKYENVNEKSTDDNNRRFECTGRMVDILEYESRMLINSVDNNNNNSSSSSNRKYSNKGFEYAYEITAFERTLLETFIFNYSCTLLTIDKSLIKCIPSPFEVFDMIAPLLFAPIFNCTVPWMNNPTAGAALPMFELQAKIIWLSFKDKFNENDLKLIKSIQKICKYYTRPIIPEEIWISYPKKISKKLLESCYISEIVAKGVYLFSLKILNKDLRIESKEVQQIVNEMFKILDCISIHSQTSVIGKWPFLVIGSAIIENEKRIKFKNRLVAFIDVLKTASLFTTLKFLEKVWNDEIGLDALFIEEYLDILAI